MSSLSSCMMDEEDANADVEEETPGHGDAYKAVEGTPYMDLELDDLGRQRPRKPGSSDDKHRHRTISNNDDGDDGDDDDLHDREYHEKPLLAGAYQPKTQPNRTRRHIVIMLTSFFFLLLGLVALVNASWFGLGRRGPSPKPAADAASTSTVPQYFQTTPQIYAGPTATGRAPFLAASNPAPFGPARSFVPNAPLETALPIVGNTQNQSIFQLMGQLSPYFPNPTGFGVNEYPLPPNTKITQLHMLSRHGSRYPTTGAGVEKFGRALTAFVAAGPTNFTGNLSFVNSWSYGLGSEILVPVGRQELFDSGVLHYYNYAKLYNTSTKIIARTTTQDRMLKSAEYFMSGFFGLDWTRNATLEPIIEGNNFNNSLAGYDNCNGSNLPAANGGTNASVVWQGIYLVDAVKRFQAMSPSSYMWNISSVYNAQTLCPYETVAYGYSAWCDLFTYEEWQGFEYSIDLFFAGNNYFQSPTGRAVGIGYVEELLARLTHHLLTSPTAQDNITLDNNTTTFPLNQTLYFDFSHDTNMAAVLTALGLHQFQPFLPAKGPIPTNRSLIISHLQPFGARIDMEILTAPHPISPLRSTDTSTDSKIYNDTASGNMTKTQYIHILINQRTLPLHSSLAECEVRDDGYCELSAFIASQRSSLDKARYEYACNGEYAPVEYGSIMDGAPL